MSKNEPGAPGVLVGYSFSTRVYTIETVHGKVERSRTCRFDETGVVARMHERPADALRTDTEQQLEAATTEFDPARAGAPDDPDVHSHPQCTTRLFGMTGGPEGPDNRDPKNDILPVRGKDQMADPDDGGGRRGGDDYTDTELHGGNTTATRTAGRSGGNTVPAARKVTIALPDNRLVGSKRG